RMRIDELELDDSPLDGDLPAAVVDAGDRMVREHRAGRRKRARDRVNPLAPHAPRAPDEPTRANRHRAPPSPPAAAGGAAPPPFAAISVLSNATVSWCGSAA